MTCLKEAFQQAREQQNIDLILPVLVRSELYVIVAETTPGDFDFVYTRSPQPDRFCVTVAENEAILASVKWPKLKISGEQLIFNLRDSDEILITYQEGGDYITKEQLQWFRQQLAD